MSGPAPDPARRVADIVAVGGPALIARASLAEFIAAQDRVWPQVEAELADGRKASHWMWFVFPQLEGLGRSATARYYGLASLDEARGYLGHPVLGPRLHRAVALMLSHRDRPPETILGPVDALKLRSCLTLFARAAPSEPDFAEALAAFYGGPDEATIALLDRDGRG